MPTSGGKPKAGERVQWRSGAWRLDPSGCPWYSGTVLERSSGQSWSLKVQPDRTGARPFWLTGAQFLLDRDALRVLEG